MRIRLLLNFKLLILQFQYIGITNFKLLQQRQYYIVSKDGMLGSSNIFESLTSNIKRIFFIIKMLKLLKVVPTDRSDWIFGDSFNNYGLQKLLFLNTTPNVGKRILHKGIDTRVLAFKKKERFFMMRRAVDWVDGGIFINSTRYVYFFNSTGIVKYRAKSWDSYYFFVDFFCGQ